MHFALVRIQTTALNSTPVQPRDTIRLSVATRTISHYEILDRIGEGGMGVVSLARDTRLGRQVALKVLRADAMQDPERKYRFAQEARAASSLNHPNIVTIYDIQSVEIGRAHV